MIGLGSFSYRWSCGFKDRIPARPLGLLGLLEKAQKVGLQLVQIADNIPIHERDEGEICELASEAKSKCIEIELGLAGATENKRLEKYLRYCGLLDCKLIRISLDARDLAKSKAPIVAKLKQFEDALSEQDVRIAFENHFSLASSDLVSIVQQLESNRYGVCLDVANSICAGEWPIETVRLLAPYTFNLHLKDCRFLIDPYGVGFAVVGTPLGQGMLDIPKILELVNPDDRKINTIIEHWLPWEDDPEKLTRREDEWVALGVEAAEKYLNL